MQVSEGFVRASHMGYVMEVYIETERLTVRELEPDDADSLMLIKNDAQVLEYDPEFICRDATRIDAVKFIEASLDNRGRTDFKKDAMYAVALKATNEMAGVITVGYSSILRETQMGWMFRGDFTGHGYASEAGGAASDFILERFGMEYLIVTIDVTKHGEVGEYFAENQARVGSNYYCFRKYKKSAEGCENFYGDVEYNGRFA